jgi:MYXO-CTERM domain-containing protein
MKDIEQRHQSAAAFSAELRSVGAVLDVRAGDTVPGELLPIDDDPGWGRWWVGLVGLGAAGAAAWYWIRR